MKKKHIYIYLLGMLLLSVGCTGNSVNLIPTSRELRTMIC